MRPAGILVLVVVGIGVALGLIALIPRARTIPEVVPPPSADTAASNADTASARLVLEAEPEADRKPRSSESEPNTPERVPEGIPPLHSGLVPPLFDGRTLDGWHVLAPWMVEDGAITCPSSKVEQPHLTSATRLTGPCEVTLQIQLLGRHVGDGRGFWIKSGNDEIHVRLDNQPDEFQILLQPSGEAVASKDYPLEEDRWYQLRCRIDADGRVTAWLDAVSVLTCNWPGTFPARFGLACQRSGARFRDISIRSL